MMMEMQEKQDVKPVCGHCKVDIDTVWYQEIRGVFGRRYIYFCPHCRAALGVSHRKGLWMG